MVLPGTRKPTDRTQSTRELTQVIPSGAVPTNETTSNIGRRRASAKQDSEPAYEARRAEITAAAAKVFLAKGYSATSFRDIAQGLDLDRATLYYYFASKQELVQTAMVAAFAGYADAAEEIVRGEGSPEEKVSRIFLMNIESATRSDFHYVNIFLQEDVTKLMTGDNRDWLRTINAHRRRYEAAITSIFEAGSAAGAFRSEVAPSMFTTALIGMGSWAQRWYDPKGPVAAQELADQLASIILHGAAG